jgi:hypothetical protein
LFFICGKQETHYRVYDGSYGQVMLGCDRRTHIAVIEELSIPGEQTKEYNELYNYLLNLRDRE